MRRAERWGPYALAVLVLCSFALEGAAATASEIPTAGPRFAGLEHLYFERLDDPAAATSSHSPGRHLSRDLAAFRDRFD